MITSVVLRSGNRPETELRLTTDFHQYTVEEILSVSKKVYGDAYYDLEIEADEKIYDARVYVNDEFVGFYSNHQLSIENEHLKKAPLFDGLLGYAWITIEVPGQDSKPARYYSEYASILVKPNIKGQNVDDMLHYIYENQADVLLEKKDTVKVGASTEAKLSDFWSRIAVIEDIVKTYEACYGYFKANSRFKLISTDVVDKVEKLQNIDSNTINYIVGHPDYLVEESMGIKYGGRRYLPQKTLMQQKKASYDIYENQVVRSFLSVVYDEVRCLGNEIEKYLNQFEDEVASKGYINSSSIFYASAREALIEYKKRILMALNRMDELDRLYREVLGNPVDGKFQLRPTMIFMTIPQYNQMYMCMSRWYGSNGLDFVKERTMMNFISVPEVYEYYVLIKLVNVLSSFGFVLKESYRVNYPLYVSSRHVVKEFCNTFVYEGGETRLTLYYEPVIYDEDTRELNGISLYRNNTVSQKVGVENVFEGHYYVPDYLIKVENNSFVKYIVCDAKYSKIANVRDKLMPQLTYKYIVSLSAIREEESIDGLAVFYGICEQESSNATFYNKRICNISPFIELCPLAETLSGQEQDKNIYNLILPTIRSLAINGDK